MTAQTGFPTPITSTLDTTGTGIISRPNQVPGQNGNLPSDQRTWQHWFNTNAFTDAAYGSFGTSPRTGAIRLPGLGNFDFSANKEFRFTARRGMQVRGEMVNRFNHYIP